MSANRSPANDPGRPVTLAMGFANHGRGRWFSAVPGESIQIRVRGGEVDGKFTVMESLVQPGTAVPLHTHREDEIFHVVEGVVTFEVAGQRFEGRPGAIVVAPAGVPHRWANFDGIPTRMMVTLAPGGVEELFEELSMATLGHIVEIASRYGSIILGPPLTR